MSKYVICDDPTDRDQPMTPEHRAAIREWYESRFHPPPLQTKFHKEDLVGELIGKGESK